MYVLYCSPKFVVTMNQVDEKYKVDTEKEVISNEAGNDLDGMLWLQLDAYDFQCTSPRAYDHTQMIWADSEIRL